MSEQHRHECEAREWLRRGYTTQAKVKELQQRISKRRGADAATRLVEEMREQWKTKSEWMECEYV